MSTNLELKRLAQDAREDLVQKQGRLSALNGACHENAVYLCNYIREQTNYTPYIRWGAVNYESEEYASLQDAEEDGAVHFWTEVKPGNTWVYIDLFSMKSANDGLPRGGLFARTTLPNSYQQLNDTLFEFTPEIHPTDLLCYADYEQLTTRIQPES